MPAAAFIVHQLRYLLAARARAGQALHETGHAYLQSLVPWLTLLVAAGAGALVIAVVRTAQGNAPARPRPVVSWRAIWLLVTGCLIGIYVAQELLEGIFATGHAAGLAGVFGAGGLWGLPSALAVGAALTWVLYGSGAALRAAARWAGRRRSPRSRSRRPLAPRWADVFILRPSPLADGASGRAPPL